MTCIPVFGYYQDGDVLRACISADSGFSWIVADSDVTSVVAETEYFDHDIGISEIISPTSGPMQIYDVEVIAKNYGNNFETTEVQVDIIETSGGTTVYSELVEDEDIDVGQEVMVDFPDWTPGDIGEYQVTACTLLNDDDPSNDCLSIIICISDTFMGLEVYPLGNAMLNIGDDLQVYNLENDCDDGVGINLKNTFNTYECTLENMLLSDDASIMFQLNGTFNNAPFDMDLSIGSGYTTDNGKGVYPVGFNGTASGAPSIIVTVYLDDVVQWSKTFATLTAVGNIEEVSLPLGVYPVGFNGTASGAPSIIAGPTDDSERWLWTWADEGIYDLMIDSISVTMFDPNGAHDGMFSDASIYGCYMTDFTMNGHNAEEENLPGADLNCDGSLAWIDVSPGETVTGSFVVENIGEPESELRWEIESYPSWGTWTFTPLCGNYLRPEDEPITVTVEVIAPDQQNQQFEGEVKIINSENPEDYCIIDVTLTTPRNRAIQTSLLKFLESYPILYQLLQKFLKF